MHMKTFLIPDIAHLDDFAGKTFCALAEKKKEKRAVVVAARGELGAGKTAFARALAKHAGVREPVSSPTFVIARGHEIAPGGAFSRFVHIDAYRLGEKSETAPLRFTAMFSDPETLAYVEWPENIAHEIPADAYTISFRIAGGEAREIKTDIPVSV